MAQTLNDILNDVAAIIDQDITLATGTDLTVRTQLVNQAVREWANAYQWKQLRINQFAPTLYPSATSLGLPSNFKKLMSRPFDVAQQTDNDYEEIRPEDAYLRKFLDVNNRFCYTGGNEATGKYLVVNPPLLSSASLVFDYQAGPGALATLQDISVVPSNTFVYKRVISKIFESRADPRFPQFASEADEAMSNMMEEESALSGAFSNTTRNDYTTQNFRIGQSS